MERFKRKPYLGFTLSFTRYGREKDSTGEKGGGHTRGCPCSKVECVVVCWVPSAYGGFNLQQLIVDTHRPQPHEVQMDQNGAVVITTPTSETTQTSQTSLTADTADFTAHEESASGMLWEMESHEAAKDSAEDEEHSMGEVPEVSGGVTSVDEGNGWMDLPAVAKPKPQHRVDVRMQTSYGCYACTRSRLVNHNELRPRFYQ
eukprot:9145476-Pyramimonas_sp.AAC.2